MRISAAWVTVSLAAALAAGCFETKADLTLNPDGSGKVTGEITFPVAAPWVTVRRETATADPATAGAGAPTIQKKTPEEETREIVSTLLRRSSGIDAWKDVSFERVGNDRIHFKGTAYFKDLSKVRIYPDRQSRLQFGRDAAKDVVLILYRPEPVADATKTTRKATPEEWAERMRVERARYLKAKGELAVGVAGFRADLVFHVPGIPAEVKGLEQSGNALSIGVDGTRLLASIDADMADNNFLREKILTGKPKLDDAIRDKVFGQKGEVWARMKGEYRPLFDYDAEMTAAKKAYPDMMVKLGLEQPRTTRPTTSSAKPADPTKKPAEAPPRKPADPSKPPSIPMPKKLPAIPTPIFLF